MSNDQFIDLIEDVCILEPNNVCFCGGEPMMELDLLVKCSDILHQNGIKSISTVSNGYFINEEVAQ